MEKAKTGIALFKNNHGELRSGWMLAMIMAVFYTVWYFLFYPIYWVALLAARITGDPDITLKMLDFVFTTALVYIIMGGLVGGLLMLLFRIVYKRPFTHIGFYKSGSVRQMLFGLLFGAAVVSFAVLLLLAAGSARVAQINLSGIQTPGVWNAFAIFLVVGFYEEILARGVMMTALKTTRNKWVIILVPSAIFGLMHIFNNNVTGFSLVNIALAGIVLSYLFVKTGRLWAPIGFHIAWNLFMGSIYGIPVSGETFDSIAVIELTGPVWFTGGAFGIEGGAVCTLVTVLGLVYIHFFVGQSKGFWYFDSDMPLTRGQEVIQ